MIWVPRVLAETIRETSSSPAWGADFYEAAARCLGSARGELLHFPHLVELISAGPGPFILHLLVSLPAAYSLALPASLQVQA